LIDIVIQNASEHNLKGISVRIPRRKITVITGVSGSGKSSLAYNIVYAEGQRRYLESLSPYARQFVHLFDKPNVEWIAGLSPTLSVSQNQGIVSAYSTVGTISEVYDFLRLLFYSCSKSFCPQCGKELKALNAHELAEFVKKNFPSSTVTILSSLVKGRKGKYNELFASLSRKGFREVRIDGRLKNINSVSLLGMRRHDIDVVIGQYRTREDPLELLVMLCNIALETGHGEIIIKAGEGEEIFLSGIKFCSECGKGVPEAQPSTFSFLSKNSRCQYCAGKGIVRCLRPESVFLNSELHFNVLNSTEYYLICFTLSPS